MVDANAEKRANDLFWNDERNFGDRIKRGKKKK